MFFQSVIRSTIVLFDRASWGQGQTFLQVESNQASQFLRRRSLKTVELEIPDDWPEIVVTIIVIWILLCCLTNVLKALCCGCRPRYNYQPIGNASRSAPYYGPPNDNTCRNLLWTACCFECCCRDNRDVDCCEVCCCLCAYEMCCRE